MTPIWIYEVFGAILGLCFGSFLNVCIGRIPHGESIVKPRSRCPECRHEIRWFDNVPLLSWILLRARCRDCKASISWQYPLVELATGVWFTEVGNRMWHAWWVNGYLPAMRDFSQGSILTLDALGLAILGFLLIGLIVMDWQTFTLPNAFTFSGIAAGIFLVCTQAIFLGPTDDQIVLNSAHQLRLRSPGSFASRGNVFLTGPEALIFGRLAAIVGVVLLLLAVRWLYKLLRHRDGMGLGDVKLLAMIAAFLGFWPSILALFAGVVLATFYAVWLLARKQANALTRLPFGSFLGIGGLVSALCGPGLIDWYMGLFR
ncbi:type 4 prepilin peptidase 1 Aspartic peptidase. MEROPS family A24A [Granulicella rosea]|uniref:Type 4 prepilin peptidase 1 Aspartic peptidase. MEROPS family A24A n=1 Tax=Granulicella rosea TaxID=474952 RepID=A0A239HUI1_9BACT|nr:A24 family peptidase [Granulicella rosea]SNS84912.1 type 4 prepilin peptidase 1 Aspartic peptidase. MEROPS family A24A [Granulicella rosea]